MVHGLSVTPCERPDTAPADSLRASHVAQTVDTSGVELRFRKVCRSLSSSVSHTVAPLIEHAALSERDARSSSCPKLRLPSLRRDVVHITEKIKCKYKIFISDFYI